MDHLDTFAHACHTPSATLAPAPPLFRFAYSMQDLLPAQRAAALVAEAETALRELPQHYRRFYLQRLIDQMSSSV